ncbi:hypothetical protein JCM10212_001224 [Sporobolomyces blumeae]
MDASRPHAAEEYFAQTPSRRDSGSDFKSGKDSEKGDALGDKDVCVIGDGSGVGQTHRGLTSRHITFIGIGGGIGTGLFIGTGAALAKAGPLGLLLAFCVVGAILWCVMESIGELATLLPMAGTFVNFCNRTIDPAVGFTLAISYGYCYTIAIASESSAAAILVSYWSDISPAVVISISLVLILTINMSSVRFYGESEFVTSIIKVLCFVGLVIVGLVITLGGAPDHQRRGFQYWRNPGAFAQPYGLSGNTGNFAGFVSAFVNAAFSFIGVETVVIAAGEAANPHKSIPKAVKRVTYRISFFYILGAIIIGMIVPYNEPALVSGTGNAASSPWVAAIKNAGIPALDSIVNACILVSAWSAGNAYCYVGSRIIVAMALDKQLPACFAKTNRWGVPYWAVLAAWLFGPFAYLSCGSGGASQAFTWLLNLSTVAGLLAWGTLCFAYIRFYKATKVQGLDRNSFPFKGRFQPFAAWFGLVGSIVITLAQGYSVFLKGYWSTSDFFASYVGILIYIVPAVFWKFYRRTKWVRASEMDLHSGRFDPAMAGPPEPEPTTWYGKVIDWLC